MTDKVYYNPTLGLQNITPALDDETFLFFLSAYYDWMQTTDITFNGASGAFSNGEIITGQDSRATATIRYVGSNTITVSMKTDVPFDLNEEIVGGTSANSAFVLELSDNVLRTASRIRENKNNEKAQGQFLEYLKGELNKGIPVKTSADRRRLIAQLKDFFKSKSTEEAYTFLFRALFNETIEIRYPGDDLLRVSDGNFLKQSTIRINERATIQKMGEASVVSGNNLVVGTNTDFLIFSTDDHFKIGTQQAVVSNVVNATHMFATTNFITTANNQFVYELVQTDIFALKNKTIRGRTSGAIGVVADVRASTLGGKSYADVILRLISGGFTANEIIEDIDSPSSNVIVYGVVSGININDGGTGYAVDDEVIITGDGVEATAKITSVSEAPITKIILANTGIGYQNSLSAVVNSTGTGGTGFAVRIAEIANTYTVGANNQYTVGDTVSLRIVNRGSGYVALPTVTLQDTAVASLGLLHDKLIRINNAGTLYQVGDPLVFTNPVGFSGNTAVGRVAAVTERWAETPVILVATEIVEPYKNESLLDDFGSNTVSVEGTGDEEVGILIEGSYYDRLKTEDWRGIGPIERLELTYSANGNYAFGSGYSTTSLPTVVVTSANGVGANLEVFNIQGKSAVINIDASNNIAGIGSIREVTILNQGIDYTTATIDATAKGDGNANLTAEIAGLFVDSGRFTNDDGKVNYKVLQDSLFYQDFSYVIRSGLSFDRYKDIVKEVVHPAGLEFFGEIVITNTISLAANFSSEIDADRAPRFASLFSFLSLWEGYGLPPPVQTSIIVKIKPVVSYVDQAVLNLPEQDGGTIQVEINPTINVGAITHTEYRPILSPVIDVGIFGAANVTVIPVSPGASEYELILAGASLPATFDPSGAVREINIEPIVINQGITVIESTDQGLKGPLQFWLGPVVVSAEFIFSSVAPRTEVSGGVGIIVSTSTFTDSEYNVEIPIFVGMTPTIIPSDQIATPKFFKTEINTAPQPSALYKVEINSIFTRLPPLTYGDLIIGDYAQDIIFYEADTKFNTTLYNVGAARNEYNIEIPSYVDVTMGFYSAITTMQTDIKSVEIDIELLQSVSSSIRASYKIDILSGEGITKGTIPFKNIPLEVYSTEKIEDFATLTFNSVSPITYPNARARVDSILEIDLPTVTLTQPLNVVPSDFFPDIKYIQPQLNIGALDYSEIEVNVETFVDATMAFYSNIVTVETDIKSVEIDIELFNSVASSARTKYTIEPSATNLVIQSTPLPSIEIEILSPTDRYKDQSINRFANNSIASFDTEPIEDRIALGAAGFVNGKYDYYYQNARLRQFSNTEISVLENLSFLDAFGNDTVRKNIPISGAVNVPTVIYDNVPLQNLNGQQINTYANALFSDSSGLRPVVFGSENNGTQNGTITFTVPADAPSTLYYICQFHGMMQGVLSIVTGSGSGGANNLTTFNVTNAGAGAYVIDGNSNPTLTLVRGNTYYFAVSAPGHPFWIKTNPNTGTSNAYNNGLATGTNFTEDFKVRDYIIIGNEKFIITDIANSNYMEINVSASQNYTNVPAYREIFV